MDISLKDACKRCNNFKTCTTPCFFAAAISDNVISVTTNGTQYKKVRNYNHPNWRDQEASTECGYIAGLETPMSEISTDDGTVNYIDNISKQEEDEDDFSDPLKTVGMRLFVDALMHGKDWERLGANFDILPESAKAVYHAEAREFLEALKFKERLSKGQECLESCKLPARVKYYLASQFFDGLSSAVIADILGVTVNAYKSSLHAFEMEVASGNVVVYKDGDSWIPATSTNYLNYLKTLPHFKKTVKSLQGGRRRQAGERAAKGLELVKQGMTVAQASREVGVDYETILKRLKRESQAA